MNKTMLFLISLLLISSCISSGKKSSDTISKTSIEANWQAVRVNGNPINRMVNTPVLELNIQEMKINGTDGCNNFFGTISELNENQISFSQIGSTRKMCPDMEIPDQFLSGLNKISQFSFDKSILIFSDQNNNEVLALMKMSQD